MPFSHGHGSDTTRDSLYRRYVHQGLFAKKLDGIADRLSYEEQIAYYQAKIEELRRHKDE